MAESYQVSQGAEIILKAPLRDANLAAITAYDGTQTLRAIVWPGGVDPVVFSPTIIWVPGSTSPNPNVVKITITSADTAIAPGTYRVLAQLQDGVNWVDIYGDDTSPVYLTISPFPLADAPSTLITRLPLERALIGRTRGLMAQVGMSTVATGNNPDLTDVIGWALQRLGVNATHPGYVADSDLAGLAAAQYSTLVDLGEYRILFSGLNSFLQPDQTISLASKKWSTVIDGFSRRLKDLQTQYAALIQVRKNPTRVGVIPTKYPTFGTPEWGLGCGRFDH